MTRHHRTSETAFDHCQSATHVVELSGDSQGQQVDGIRLRQVNRDPPVEAIQHARVDDHW